MDIQELSEKVKQQSSFCMNLLREVEDTVRSTSSASSLLLICCRQTCSVRRFITPARQSSKRARARSLRTSCLLMKLTVLRRRCRVPCLKPCRNATSQLAMKRSSWTNRSWCLPRRTRLSRKVRIRCRKLRWTVSS